MTKQAKSGDLHYLINPGFNKVNRLFFWSFKYEEDRTCFSNYYTPKVKTKGYNVLIDGKSFFDVPVKNKEEAYKKLLKWVKILIT